MRWRAVTREDGGAPSLAVPVDANNASARYAQALFEEIVKLGEANARRIYDDFPGGFEVRKGPGNAIHIRREAAPGEAVGKTAPAGKGKGKTPSAAGATEG